MNIAFLETSPSIYTYKLGKALKNRGHHITLISFFDFNKDLYKSAYHKRIEFRFNSFSPTIKNGINILLKLPRALINCIKIRRLKPDVIIGSATPYPYWLPAFACYSLKKIMPKTSFIFFPYDVNLLKYKKKEYYKRAGIKNFELKAERYLLTNADGIIFKGGEIDVVKKSINIKCPTISFPPYAMKEFMAEINLDKLSKKDGQTHIVFIGFLAFESEDEVKSFGMGSSMDAIKNILKQKLHFHVYTNQYEQIKKSTKFKKTLQNNYFHLHHPKNPFEIVKEISKYDFGLNPCNFNTKIMNISLINTETANKVAAYIEAGIPCIHDKRHTTAIELMKRYGLDLYYSKSNMSEIKEIIKKEKYEDLLKKVIKLRGDFRIERNIGRFERFIYGLKKS